MTARWKSWRRPALLMLFGAACLAPCPGCATGFTATAWSPSFDPPSRLDTDRVHLEPLGPDHAALDHAAFMSSRDHLQRTLHWGSWPRPDTTVEENASDLQRHADEFVAREGYAYTVLVRDRSRCVGCVYINPIEEDPSGAELAYWVVESGVRTDLDRSLLESVLAWFEADWPFEQVVMDVHVDNQRGIAIASDLGGANEAGAPDDHLRFVFRR